MNEICEIDKQLTGVFNDILTIEEITLKNGAFKDLTVKEMHTIEAIGLYESKTAGEVAKTLDITLGTLTIAINSLEKKNYVSRTRAEDDRRVVYLCLTKKGKVAFRIHRSFHDKMVNEALLGLSEAETKVLISCLSKLHKYLASNIAKGSVQ